MADRSSCSSSEGKGKNVSKKIVIVGAGISGLACGYRLRELGFQNVCILEARSRIGGRIHGITFGSNFIEMGAQWIHGQKNNIIYEIAESKGLVNTDAFNIKDAMKRLTNFSQNEREVLTVLFDFLEDKTEHIPENCCSGVSLLSYLDEQFKTFLSEFEPSSFIDCLTEGYEWYCKFLLEINGCNNLSLLSLNMLSNYKECEGNSHVELKNGYSSVVNLLLKVIPPEWILKNKSVIKIDWSDFKNQMIDESKILECNSLKSYKSIKVLCDDGEIFLADHVVITISLGCLKKYSETLFFPSLCKTKQNAIQCLGFGTVNKIYLEFKEPFWEASAVFIVFHQMLCDKQLLKEGSDKYKDPSECWVQCINRFAYTPGHPNMLCAWIAGEGAATMELLPNERIVSNCMKILENILGRKLELPSRIYRSSWHCDPFACGSYSYLSTDCEKEGVSSSDIAEPVYANLPCSKHPVLMFAGEATHDCYFSTVHGAYETGLREAERLFQHYRNLDIVKLANPWESLQHRMGDLLTSEASLRSKLHVVIVGAGIAGLTCALHLANNNFTKITILEAQNKIGGRVSTVNYNGTFLELGAQWIHGCNNGLYDFSKIHKLLPHIQQETSYEGQGTFCTSDGEVIETAIVEEVRKILDDAKIKLDEGKYDTKMTKSVMTFLSEAFDSYVEEACDKSNLSLKRDLFNWYIKFEVIDNACDDMNTIAVQSFTEWDDCPEDMYHINFQKGYNSLLDNILSQIPKNSLYLNTPVQKINWIEKYIYEDSDYYLLQDRSDNKFPVSLECGNKEKLYADSVIVTASAGFLKENVDSFFCPSLPSNKLKALSKIGFGTVNKIFLVYDKPFWSSEDFGFHFVWKCNGIGKCDRLFIENSWIHGITGFDVLQNSPNILLGWIGGEDARLMENIDQEKVSNVCTDLLRIFLNCPDIPYPIQIFRSRWYSNPYIRGSYSNRTLEYYKDDSSLHDLQYPLCSTVVTKVREVQLPIMSFAGEAFDENSFSSAHGAFHSGLKAADCLIKRCLEIEADKEK